MIVSILGLDEIIYLAQCLEHRAAVFYQTSRMKLLITFFFSSGYLESAHTWVSLRRSPLDSQMLSVTIKLSFSPMSEVPAALGRSQPRIYQCKVPASPCPPCQLESLSCLPLPLSSLIVLTWLLLWSFGGTDGGTEVVRRARVLLPCCHCRQDLVLSSRTQMLLFSWDALSVLWRLP